MSFVYCWVSRPPTPKPSVPEHMPVIDYSVVLIICSKAKHQLPILPKNMQTDDVEQKKVINMNLRQHWQELVILAVKTFV